MRFSERKRLLREKYALVHSSNGALVSKTMRGFSPVRFSEREPRPECESPRLCKQIAKIKGPRWI